MKKKLCILSVMAMLMSCGTVEAAAEQSEVAGNISFDVGERAFEFLRYDIGTDYKGNLAIILSFDYTNRSEDADMALGNFGVQIFQNGIEKDSCIVDYGSQWEKYEENLGRRIKDGATLTVCEAFLLDDAQAPVEVEVLEFINFDETQKMKIDISQYAGSVSEPEPEKEQTRTFESEYTEMSENYAFLQSEYETLQSEYEALQLKYDTLAEGKNEESESEEDIRTEESDSGENKTEEMEEDAASSYFINSIKAGLNTSFDPDIETDIVFEDVAPFFSSEQNYRTIINNVEDSRIEELKTAVGNYESTHKDDSVLLNAILDALNKYGDFSNVVTEVDSFSGEKNIFYDGYTGINSEHYVYPHSSGSDYLLSLGFVKDGWLFAESMILKRASERINDGIWFRGKGYEFERDIVDGTLIKEYKEERLYDSDVDYLLKDMSEEMVIRFEADNGEKLDYVLTDQDKQALQNIAKYVKLRNVLFDLYRNDDLYYTEVPEGSMISGGLFEANIRNPFQFDVELANKRSEYEKSKYYATFDFTISNHYEKTIAGINGIGTLIDSKGKQIGRIRFNFTDMKLQPGELLNKQMYLECKSYAEEYKIAYEDFMLVYVPESVTFSDGTSEEF